MKLISTHELEGRNGHDLAELFREVSRKLAQTERGTAARCNGLASLETINNAQARLMIAGS